MPAVPLKLRIPPPLTDPSRSIALTRLVREGSTRALAFFLPARERQCSGSSRGSHRPPRLLRRTLDPSPSRPLTGVYALPGRLSTFFGCILFVLQLSGRLFIQMDSPVQVSFRPVHGSIGLFEHVRIILFTAVAHGDADTDADPFFPVRQHDVLRCS